MTFRADIPTFDQYQTRNGTAELSVITTVRNGAKTIGRTITSIREQNVSGLDYVIIDANSTDGTVDIIRQNEDLVSYWISERDSGISDGFNKGIAASVGSYILLLNADDWLSPGQLSAGVSALNRSGADFVFGDLVFHGKDGSALHRIRGDHDYGISIRHTMPAINHPTVIVRRTAYEKHGLFDLELHRAMDYDLLLRLHNAGCKGVYEPAMVGHMSLEGESDRHRAAALREVRDISIRHGYPATPAYLRYLFRLLKTWGRGQIERLLPNSVSVGMRRVLNKYITHE